MTIFRPIVHPATHLPTLQIAQLAHGGRIRAQPRLYIEVKDPTFRNPATAEAAAAFWHMVDLLWLVIFALMYLLR